MSWDRRIRNIWAEHGWLFSKLNVVDSLIIFPQCKSVLKIFFISVVTRNHPKWWEKLWFLSDRAYVSLLLTRKISTHFQVNFLHIQYIRIFLVLPLDAWDFFFACAHWAHWTHKHTSSQMKKYCIFRCIQFFTNIKHFCRTHSPRHQDITPSSLTTGFLRFCWIQYIKCAYKMCCTYLVVDTLICNCCYV